MVNIAKAYENIVKMFDDSELIIFVKNGKTNIVDHGEVIKGVQSIDFSASIDEMPELIIRKVVSK